ncbi:hypothetical protein HHI36_018445 [Cryptolaemus montrouzieri]|uniref:Uncharacterized protein n=1 Tax=Cryptolaemus montrouzieri TaxID=559131 RepID=A0ABD2NZZ6_9CUCU
MVQQPDTSSLDSNDFEDDSKYQIETVDSRLHPSGSAVVLQQNSPEERPPTFGNISVTNGTDIHFGNKTFYQGPVTIQQFLYGNNIKKAKKISESDFSTDAIGETDNSDIVSDFKTGIDNLACDETTTVIKKDDIDVKNNVKQAEQTVDKNEYATDHPLKHLLFNYRKTAVSVFVLVLILSVVAIVVPLVYRTTAETIEPSSEHLLPKDEESDHNTPVKAPIDPVTSLQPLKLKIVSRLEWLAQPPFKEVNTLKTPVPYVIISHTATENCSSQAQCKFQVRNIQTYHMESNGWWDIGYNFLVGGDGEVYFGRGWNKEGAHTYGYNIRSIGISFIGTFISMVPPGYQLIACKKLIQKGVDLGYIQKDYKLVGARQLQTTKSPGEALYREIQTWPHWVRKP